MPTKEIIGGNKITERMLVPHLRKRIFGKSVYQVVENQTLELWGTCGATIEQGKAVTLGGDGKIYLADAFSRKPVFGFAQTAGEIDEQIPLRNKGTINVTIMGNVDTGGYVYLRSNGEIGTIERLHAGDIIQIVGTKKSEEQIEISILECYEIE